MKSIASRQQRILPVLLVCLSLLPLRQAVAQEATSAVTMKMTEHLNDMVLQGVTTMNTMRRSVEPAPAATPATVTRLKMDKINSRYVEQQDQIVDRVYRLVWSRCSLGQRWDHDRCVGTVRQYTYDQALMRANEQWRLPTRAELATLIDRSRKNMPEALAIDSVAFPDMDLDKLMYWSSEEENNSFAWAVLFADTGVSGVLYRSHRYAVRLVRSMPAPSD